MPSKPLPAPRLPDRQCVIPVLSYKGGVGKTTTALHLAAYFQQFAPTLLIDGDANRCSLEWAQRGKLLFDVTDDRAAGDVIENYRFVILDTPARPTAAEINAIAVNSDLMIIPTTPDAVSMSVTLQLITALAASGVDPQRYRILLTLVPPLPSKVGESARLAMLNNRLPVFASTITRRSAFTQAALLGVAVNALPAAEAKRLNAAAAWKQYEQIGAQILDLLLHNPSFNLQTHA